MEKGRESITVQIADIKTHIEQFSAAEAIFEAKRVSKSLIASVSKIILLFHQYFNQL